MNREESFEDLIAGADQYEEMPADVRARMERLVVAEALALGAPATFALGAVGSSLPTPAGSGTAGGLTNGAVAKLAIVVVIGAAAGLVGAEYERAATTPARAAFHKLNDGHGGREWPWPPLQTAEARSRALVRGIEANGQQAVVRRSGTSRTERPGVQKTHPVASHVSASPLAPEQRRTTAYDAYDAYGASDAYDSESDYLSAIERLLKNGEAGKAGGMLRIHKSRYPQSAFPGWVSSLSSRVSDAASRHGGTNP